MSFSPKAPGEVEYVGFDFSKRLATGETLQTAVFSISVIDGTDPAAASMLQGAASISGAVARQKIGGGVLGVHYLITGQVTTSTNQTLIEAAALVIKNPA